MLEELLEKADEELRLREQAVNEIRVKARRARILSKQAIQHVHGDAVQAAGTKLQEARSLMREMEDIIGRRSQLWVIDQVRAAQEEYAEACIVYELKTKNTFPSPETIGISLTTYLMGLGDVPGELRRQALDALRVGNVELAESQLEVMERIYLGLGAMEEVPLLKGLRRKLDIARGIIERTRSEVTSEVGRRRLNESIKRLKDKLEEENS